jgi:MFS family permease
MMAFTAMMGPIGRSLSLEPWHMGTALTISGMAWVITARPWGMASDRHGRRPVMLVGLTGFALSFAALCLFTSWALISRPALWLAFAGLVICRTLAGACFAVVPTAGTALIADHLPPQNRSRAVATVGMASGASMVLGPALTGLLALQGFSLPLAAIALLPFIALAGIWWGLPKAPRPQHKAQPPAPPRWHDRRLRAPALAALVAMGSVAVAQIIVGFYAIDRLDLTPAQGAQVAGLALTAVGVALIGAQMVVRLLPLAPHSLIRIGALISALGFGAVVLVENKWGLYGCYFLAAAGMGLIWPSLSAQAANAVSPEEQGAAAGTITAAQGLGTIIGPLLGTLLYGLSPWAPYAVVAVLLVGLFALHRASPQQTLSP